MEIKNFEPRTYQLSIVKTCKEKNTLVCLPTGTGKTKIGILLSIERLNSYEKSQVLVLTPTKPLAAQICKEFKDNTTIDEDRIILLTGSIIPEKRMKFYNDATVIVATPQTINEDLINNRCTLSEYSLLMVDECHRSKENYANTKVSKFYSEQSKFPRILALTASPSSSKDSIDLICKNLSIESIEIRTENDEDLKEFIQKKDVEKIFVDFPEDFKAIHDLIKQEYKLRLEGVKSFGIHKPISVINKTDLLMLQKRLQGEIRNGNKSAFYGISLVSQLLKLDYCLNLLETQTPNAMHNFLTGLKNDESKAAKSILASENVKEAIELSYKLIDKKTKHPKLNKLLEILKKEMKINSNYKSIVFANFRNTVVEIVDELNKSGISAIKFVGQADRQDKGLKQKEQIEIIENFKNGKFNVLVASSVGEEGLDIPEVNSVIFYESIGSELRKIQRSGSPGLPSFPVWNQ